MVRTTKNFFLCQAVFLHRSLSSRQLRYDTYNIHVLQNYLKDWKGSENWGETFPLALRAGVSRYSGVDTKLQHLRTEPPLYSGVQNFSQLLQPHILQLPRAIYMQVVKPLFMLSQSGKTRPTSKQCQQLLFNSHNLIRNWSCILSTFFLLLSISLPSPSSAAITVLRN